MPTYDSITVSEAAAALHRRIQAQLAAVIEGADRAALDELERVGAVSTRYVAHGECEDGH